MTPSCCLVTIYNISLPLAHALVYIRYCIQVVIQLFSLDCFVQDAVNFTFSLIYTRSSVIGYSTYMTYILVGYFILFIHLFFKTLTRNVCFCNENLLGRDRRIARTGKFSIKPCIVKAHISLNWCFKEMRMCREVVRFIIGLLASSCGCQWTPEKTNLLKTSILLITS